MRIEQLEKHVEAHGDSLKRYFERLEILENKPAKAALRMGQNRLHRAFGYYYGNRNIFLSLYGG
jgi:hypothetical protein